MQNLRPAIAMIELIFAMVIMGIALMSAPQLISQAQKSSYTSMQQEGIAAAASQISFVLSRHWDEANTAQVGKPTILNADTSAGINLQPQIPLGTLAYRVGTPTTGKHRTFVPKGTNVVLNATAQGALGRDGAENDTNDIDDYDGTTAMLRSVNANGNGADDYIDKTMEMTTRVQYIDDAPNNMPQTFNNNGLQLTYPINTNALSPLPVLAQSSNVKWVSVTLREAAATAAAGVNELHKNITLYAFSCNIGGYEFKEITP